MKNPYQKKLEELVREEIIINRSAASDLKGKLRKTDDDGCYIEVKNIKDSEGVTIFFVAYENICGVGKEDWDYDIID